MKGAKSTALALLVGLSLCHVCQAQDALPRLTESSMSDLSWVVIWDQENGILTNVSVLRVAIEKDKDGVKQPRIRYIAGSGYRQRNPQAVQVPGRVVGALVPFLTAILNEDATKLDVKNGKVEMSFDGVSFFDPGDEYMLADKIDSGKIPSNLLSGPTTGEARSLSFSMKASVREKSVEFGWPLQVKIDKQSRKLNKKDCQSLLLHLVKVARVLRDAGITNEQLGIEPQFQSSSWHEAGRNMWGGKCKALKNKTSECTLTPSYTSSGRDRIEVIGGASSLSHRHRRLVVF